MTELELVTDPDHPNEYHITAGLSSLNTGTSGPSPESAPRTRKPAVIHRRFTGGVGGTSTREFLDIRPLSKAWRQVTMKVPPFSHLIFDLTLPKANEGRNDSFRKVYWDIGMPQEARDVMNLVVTIATETRIRAKGNVCFELVYDETKGVAPRVLSRLDRQLLALQRFPGKKDGRGRMVIDTIVTDASLQAD